MAGDELGQVAPVRADVGKGARGPPSRSSTRQLSSSGAGANPEIGAVQKAQGAGLPAADTLAGLRTVG